MNFRRIQIIFLITFVIIDIMLFSIFNQNMNPQSQDDGSGNSNIIKEMRNDQITLKTPAKNNGTGYYLSGNRNDTFNQEASLLENQTTKFSNHVLQSTFKRPIAMYSSHPEEKLNQLIKSSSFVINGSQYQYNSQLSDSSTVVYVQKAFGSQLYSNFGEIRFKINDDDGDKRLVGYTQTYLTNLTTLREKAQTISEEQALSALYQYNEIPNSSKVEWTSLSYTRYITVKNNYIFIPTWIIAYKTANSSSYQIKCINAFSGSIINDDSVKTTIEDM
ncbi:two-component system regulatory protein YycI [Nicoliella spurrieriana]|uniref:Two-component system regulatory protein YycI n=1 Tax=Nicoliella spurrieriana TaxID=2925830 RepID=A0A976RTB5_9LACO|nr:two-component system regulatory protein YycI [Nicoliella spurrieriana]UQS87261.1 two-component system regulatory protein YycI [Nicoliella spurrieriana]